MKTLVAPLNWGLGHASRCVALVRRLLASGDDVVIGGDGESLALLRQHFPELRYVELAPLELRYSKGNSQVWALACSIPKVLRWMIQDHRRMQEIQRVEQFDRIVSDNRFGCWVDDDDVDVDDDGGVVTVYMTHQVHICLPCGWQWAEGIASSIHACVYNKYKELWIPDYEEEERSLAGRLSHGERGKREQGKGNRIMGKYIGPLSRFESLDVARIKAAEPAYDVVAVLSGLEPQRTMLEEAIRSWAVRTPEERVLIVRGKVARSANENVDVDDDVDVDDARRANVVMVDSMGDDELARVMMGAKRIIARSGYSTIMDLACLRLLDKAELIPTPGQSEQEYLKQWIENITNKK